MEHIFPLQIKHSELDAYRETFPSCRIIGQSTAISGLIITLSPTNEELAEMAREKVNSKTPVIRMFNDNKQTA